MNRYAIIALVLFLVLIVLGAFVYITYDNKINSILNTTPAPQPAETELFDVGKFVAVVPEESEYDYSFGNELAKQAIIDAIAKDKGVKIDFEVIEISEENFINELNNLIAASSSVDSITVDLELFNYYIENSNLVKPIDSLLDMYGTNIYDTIDESYINMVTYDNHVYGIPSMPYPEHSIMVARSEQLYTFSPEPITSFTSLISLCNFYKTAGFEYPMAVTWDQLIDILAYSFFVSPYDFTFYKDELLLREQSQKYMKYMLTEMKLMYESGYLHPDLFSATEQQMKEEVISGRSAIYVAEFDNLIYDRANLKESIPGAELRLITPIKTKYMERHPRRERLSGEDKVDRILMFTSQGQNNQALMTYLDWMYSSAANYTMAKLGAFDLQIVYYPESNKFEYLDGYTQTEKPYGGIFTLGLSTDMLYAPPTHVELTQDILAWNDLQTSIHNFLSESDYIYDSGIKVSEAAQYALDEYSRIMRMATEKYIKGEIGVDEYIGYENECINLGLTEILYNEIMTEYNTQKQLQDTLN